MTTIDFKHKMAAHCETGTVSAICAHNGLELTEPMSLGIAGGIFFAYLQSPRLPFPTIVTRSRPGDIRKYISKRVGVKFIEKTYKNRIQAKTELDSLLNKNIPVAIQVDMFNMDYIPHYMKVHFNGHFVVVVGHKENLYTISDCYYPELAQVSESSLDKGRFAKGELAPNGLLFYPEKINYDANINKAIINGIKHACKYMLKLPVPFIGIKGIRLFGKKIINWPNIARNEEHLSHEIMSINVSLEERGTGGAGFRFMYASFLQQASVLLKKNDLFELSKEIMGIGDRWREISLHAARMGKNHNFKPNNFLELSDMIFARADEEELFFKKLLASIK